MNTNIKFDVCSFHIYLNNNKNNEIYKKIRLKTDEINTKYCEVNNYTYNSQIISENRLDNFLINNVFNFNNNIEKTWIFKYQFILDKLEKSTADYIVFIEYDACFCNLKNKLQSYINDTHDIFYSRCNWNWDINNYLNNVNNLIQYLNKNLNNIKNYDLCSSYLTSPEYINYVNYLTNAFFCNEGFYIFKNTEISKHFLKAIIQYSTLFANTSSNIFSSQGQIVQKIMANTKFLPHISQLPALTQGHIYGSINKFDNNKCLICHNSGINKQMLLSFLDKINI